jgi:Flp pilus assembly protein TadG
MKAIHSLKNRRGNVLLEFMLMGVPILFLTISVFEVSMMMWQYVSMDQTVQSTAQYISVHGYNCNLNTNNCTITVGNIASYIEATSPGLDPSRLNITLYTASCVSNTCTNTSTVSCSPLNTCNSNSSTFPPLADNAVGNDIQVQASYRTYNPIVMFFPSKSTISTGDVTLGATSTQRIQF